MAECGHCGKKVKGIRDHIKAKHGDKYYAHSDADDKYYSYKFLRNCAPGLVVPKKHWDMEYELGFMT